MQIQIFKNFITYPTVLECCSRNRTIGIIWFFTLECYDWFLVIIVTKSL